MVFGYLLFYYGSNGKQFGAKLPVNEETLVAMCSRFNMMLMQETTRSGHGKAMAEGRCTAVFFPDAECINTNLWSGGIRYFVKRSR